MPVDTKNRALGALLGLAVGDALGAPLEFTRRDTLPEVRDLIGGGPFRLKPGEWTDDMSMALCLADSLIACRALDPADLLRRFVGWQREGDNSVTGRCFDIGVTTSRSLARFERSGQTEAGPEDPHQAGNGSLMRLAPVALFAASDAVRAAELAELQSRTTHPAPVAHDACRFFAELLVEAIGGATKHEVLRTRPWGGAPEIVAIAGGNWRGKTREQISSSGYVVHTLEAALWCVERSSGFEEALILAVNLADDSDTVGAVTGQLAGALWGKSGIPGRWLEQLAWRERIEGRAEALIGVGST
ncbi:MAG: ADP-ribosylglycohydrolase family protein [Rhizobiales bacterium]|nr:ADP-ribosylglycohydrolase family protein [Hyphomicrobiales bacterium]